MTTQTNKPTPDEILDLLEEIILGISDEPIANVIWTIIEDILNMVQDTIESGYRDPWAVIEDYVTNAYGDLV